MFETESNSDTHLGKALKLRTKGWKQAITRRVEEEEEETKKEGITGYILRAWSPFAFGGFICQNMETLMRTKVLFTVQHAVAASWKWNL